MSKFHLLPLNAFSGSGKTPLYSDFYYLRRRLTSGEGIVSQCVSVCPLSRDCTPH